MSRGATSWSSTVCPYGVMSRAAAYRLALRTSSGSRPQLQAIASITRSIAIIPCGPPNPRNAVFDTVLVLMRRE